VVVVAGHDRQVERAGEVKKSAAICSDDTSPSLACGRSADERAGSKAEDYQLKKVVSDVMAWMLAAGAFSSAEYSIVFLSGSEASAPPLFFFFFFSPVLASTTAGGALSIVPSFIRFIYAKQTPVSSD
jgi:hypothetical protein